MRAHGLRMRSLKGGEAKRPPPICTRDALTPVFRAMSRISYMWSDPIRSGLLHSYPQLPQVWRWSGNSCAVRVYSCADLEPLPAPARESHRPVFSADMMVDIPPFVSRSFGTHFVETGFCQPGQASVIAKENLCTEEGYATPC